MIRVLGTIFAAMLGLAFGSFLNVCASRWPAGESIVRPRSHCRFCAHTLAWWENVPLASWLALGGRCRSCRRWIGWRYPLAELAVGVLWAISAWRFFAMALDPRASAALVVYELAMTAGAFLFLWLLTALAVLDAEHLWLPDKLTLSGAALGYLFFLGQLFSAPKLASFTGLALTAGMENERWGLYGIAGQRLLAMLAAAGLVLFFRWTYWLLRRREGVGLGDAKLMAMLAAWLGLPGALVAFVLGVALGFLAALATLAIFAGQRKSWAAARLPLGAFLCIGGAVSSLWGQRIVALYMRWCGF